MDKRQRWGGEGGAEVNCSRVSLSLLLLILLHLIDACVNDYKNHKNRIFNNFNRIFKNKKKSHLEG